MDDKKKLFERMNSIGQMPINEEDKKWMQKAVKEPGSLHKRLGIPEEDKIPMERINKEIAKIDKKYEGKEDEKMNADDREFKRELVLAKTFKKTNESVNEAHVPSSTPMIQILNIFDKEGYFPMCSPSGPKFVSTEENPEEYEKFRNNFSQAWSKISLPF